VVPQLKILVSSEVMFEQLKIEEVKLFEQ